MKYMGRQKMRQRKKKLKGKERRSYIRNTLRINLREQDEYGNEVVSCVISFSK